MLWRTIFNQLLKGVAFKKRDRKTDGGKERKIRGEMIKQQLKNISPEILLYAKSKLLPLYNPLDMIT